MDKIKIKHNGNIKSKETETLDKIVRLINLKSTIDLTKLEYAILKLCKECIK